MSLSYSDKPWLKSYDKGVPTSMDVPNYPVQHFLEEGVRRLPDSTAMIFQGREFSYRELNDAADAIAAGWPPTASRRVTAPSCSCPTCPSS